jgi:hypothetical protein
MDIREIFDECLFEIKYNTLNTGQFCKNGRIILSETYFRIKSNLCFETNHPNTEGCIVATLIKPFKKICIIEKGYSFKDILNSNCFHLNHSVITTHEKSLLYYHHKDSKIYEFKYFK